MPVMIFVPLDEKMLCKYRVYSKKSIKTTKLILSVAIDGLKKLVPEGRESKSLLLILRHGFQAKHLSPRYDEHIFIQMRPSFSR